MSCLSLVGRHGLETSMHLALYVQVTVISGGVCNWEKMMLPDSSCCVFPVRAEARTSCMSFPDLISRSQARYRKRTSTVHIHVHYSHTWVKHGSSTCSAGLMLYADCASPAASMQLH